MQQYNGLLYINVYYKVINLKYTKILTHQHPDRMVKTLRRFPLFLSISALYKLSIENLSQLLSYTFKYIQHVHR